MVSMHRRQRGFWEYSEMKWKAFLIYIFIGGILIGGTVSLWLNARGASRIALLLRKAGAQVLDRPLDERILSHTLKDPSSGTIRLESLLSPVTLINLWGAFCAPCKEEFPSLVSLATSHPKIRILAVSYDPDWKAVSDFLREQGVPPQIGGMEILMDGEADENTDLKALLGTHKIPETYVVLNERIIGRFIGSVDWTSPRVIALIRYLEEAVN